MNNYELDLLNALYDLLQVDSKLISIKQCNILNTLMDKADKENLIW
jgi:hypothetical protein